MHLCLHHPKSLTWRICHAQCNIFRNERRPMCPPRAMMNVAVFSAATHHQRTKSGLMLLGVYAAKKYHSAKYIFQWGSFFFVGAHSSTETKMRDCKGLSITAVSNVALLLTDIAHTKIRQDWCECFWRNGYVRNVKWDIFNLSWWICLFFSEYTPLWFLKKSFVNTLSSLFIKYTDCSTWIQYAYHFVCHYIRDLNR